MRLTSSDAKADKKEKRNRHELARSKLQDRYFEEKRHDIRRLKICAINTNIKIQLNFVPSLDLFVIKTTLNNDNAIPTHLIASICSFEIGAFARFSAIFLLSLNLKNTPN